MSLDKDHGLCYLLAQRKCLSQKPLTSPGQKWVTSLPQNSPEPGKQDNHDDSDASKQPLGQFPSVWENLCHSRDGGERQTGFLGHSWDSFPLATRTPFLLRFLDFALEARSQVSHRLLQRYLPFVLMDSWNPEGRGRQGGSPQVWTQQHAWLEAVGLEARSQGQYV